MALLLSVSTHACLWLTILNNKSIRLSNNKARKCLNHQTPKMVFESGIINQQKICT
ncbi:hypothetical protein BSPLISOX_1559 [uncultured Gammaproteobacteria bacterium]|nr:hypothetical protein BSPLISOX_1559 [uncultured Gammaproteobacteria bacterium]